MVIYSNLFSIVDGFNAVIDFLSKILEYIGKLFEGGSYISQIVDSLDITPFLEIVPEAISVTVVGLFAVLGILAVLRWLM